MEEIISKLNNLLGTLYVHRANIQGAHWNMRGSHVFLFMHRYFDEMYAGNTAHIDAMAEFVRILGKNPNYTLTKFLARSYVTEASEQQVVNFKVVLKKALQDNEKLVELSKKLFTSSEEYPDINDYAAVMVADFGKRAWFLTSSIMQKDMEEEYSESGEEEED